MVQGLGFHAPTAGGAGLISGQGTEIPEEALCTPKQNKVLEFYQKIKQEHFSEERGVSFLNYPEIVKENVSLITSNHRPLIFHTLKNQVTGSSFLINCEVTKRMGRGSPAFEWLG